MKNTDASGGTRYSEGKPGGWWFAPLLGLRLIAPVWEMGASKYAPKDWQEGQSYSTLMDCAMRHMLQVMHHGVQARDPESGHLHLAHVGWNILCLLTFIELGRDDLDDTTMWNGVTAEHRKSVGAEYPPAMGTTPGDEKIKEYKEWIRPYMGDTAGEWLDGLEDPDADFIEDFKPPVIRPIPVCQDEPEKNTAISHVGKINEDYSILNHTLIRRERDGALCCGACIDDINDQCDGCSLHSHEIHWLRAILPVEECLGGGRP